MTDFLSVEDVLTLHADQVEMYGGDQGVRDLGLLESAVAQPQAASEKGTSLIFFVLPWNISDVPFFTRRRRPG